MLEILAILLTLLLAAYFFRKFQPYQLLKRLTDKGHYSSGGFPYIEISTTASSSSVGELQDVENPKEGSAAKPASSGSAQRKCYLPSCALSLEKID